MTRRSQPILMTWSRMATSAGDELLHRLVEFSDRDGRGLDVGRAQGALGKHDGKDRAREGNRIVKDQRQEGRLVPDSGLAEALHPPMKPGVATWTASIRAKVQAIRPAISREHMMPGQSGGHGSCLDCRISRLCRNQGTARACAGRWGIAVGPDQKPDLIISNSSIIRSRISVVGGSCTNSGVSIGSTKAAASASAGMLAIAASFASA